MQNDKANFKNEFARRLVKFTVSVLAFADTVSNRNARPILDQLIRSAGSIGANVTEAKAASSRRDFTNYFQIALKSANESVYWLEVLKEYQRNHTEAERLQVECREIANMLASSVLKLKDRR